MYKKRFQGFKSLEAYRETSKTNSDLYLDNQCKQSVSTKCIAFVQYILSSQALAQSASTQTTRILRMVM